MSPVSRGFRHQHRAPAGQEDRVPPGQYVTEGFPVLSAGPTPHTPLEQWTFSITQGDELELRGPVGGYFVWEPGDGGPLLLLAGGSGVVPLRSILRHRQRSGSDVPACLLYSSRSWEDVIYATNSTSITTGCR